MNDLATHEQLLPDTLEDLTRFVLVGREKLTCVRAEIRAIDKVNLAQEVRNQKRDEARMLSEALLDAEVRLGDLLKLIPKDNNFRGNQYSEPSGQQCPSSKPKKEVIQDLGFSEKQAQRFETLADNKDLVEHVKQEARENDDIPTRTRVIDLAQQRKKKEAEEKKEDFSAYIDNCKKVANRFNEAIYAFIRVDTSLEQLKMWKELLEDSMIPSYLSEVESNISKLIAMQNFLKGVKK